MEMHMTGLNGTLAMFVVGGGILIFFAFLNKWHLDRLEREIAEDEARRKR